MHRAASKRMLAASTSAAAARSRAYAYAPQLHQRPRATPSQHPHPHPHHRTLATAPTTRDDDPTLLYTGPLTQTFRRLKLFSLSSLALAGTLSPFIFVVESSLPTGARAALAAAALATSGVSTALVAWCGRPYVTALRRLPTAGSADTDAGAGAHHTGSHNANAPAGIELATLTVTLAPRATRVYDPAFLGDTRRAFARWELARAVQLPPEDAGGVRAGEEETVAETVDRAGRVLGRWIVRWGEGGAGVCRAEGRVETHFNVHEELLSTPIR